MKPLVVIPARGGSKELPGKNIKFLAGKPLIHYTIEAAREVFEDERICISTDSKEIKSVAEQTGIRVPFLRPKEFATDEANSEQVLVHAMEFYKKNSIEFDVVIMLQVTSPLRTQNHIRQALSLYDPNIEMVVSVKETDANPYYVLKEENEEGFLIPSKKSEFTRRQDCPKVYELNGSIYVINRKALEEQGLLGLTKVIKFVMNKNDSIDIDDMLDFKMAEFILNDL